MKPGLLSSHADPNGDPPPAQRRLRLLRSARRGAVLGLAAGLLLLGGVLAVAGRCLPFHIASPPPPWPWYCTDPAYSALGYLAFPVNLLTDDLARAILLAPLSLALYVLLGALLGLARTSRKPRGGAAIRLNHTSNQR